ncbi:MAG: cytoplasmic protein [Myxococcota bacterium]|nr:cytoplasmic protein [Myxococcota bacterium]
MPRQKLPPSGDLAVDIVNAHTWCDAHREVLRRSAACGCFSCAQIYSFDAIEEWIGSDTALCPKCGIDAVIGSASGYPIETDFLRRMRDHFFLPPREKR